MNDPISAGIAVELVSLLWRVSLAMGAAGLLLGVLVAPRLSLPWEHE